MSQAAQIFKELDQNKVRPFYLIVGDEPFQISEITHKIKAHFITTKDSADFTYETFDGETSDPNQLMASLNMLPGLFDEPNSYRLIKCDRFDKFNAGSLDILKPYFDNPSPTTAFLIIANKIDKRKAWVKTAQQKGLVVEVSEPYDNDWPRWRPYFEKKSGKQIEIPAWEYLVECSGKTLSLVWQEVQKAATYVGDKPAITFEDLESLLSSNLKSDIFRFADDVIAKRKFLAMKGFEALTLEGESEIKILSILVRQFRMVERCQRLLEAGVQDPKVLAPEIGTHPYFLGKILELAKKQSPQEIQKGIHWLAETDYSLKTGQNRLFESFLTRYLS
jgi:DNA polymerase-3 subunit delta